MGTHQRCRRGPRRPPPPSRYSSHEPRSYPLLRRQKSVLLPEHLLLLASFLQTLLTRLYFDHILLATLICSV